jgi:pilus assembly protein Flp/PilA
MSSIKAFLNDEEGAAAVEYGLILALISVAIIAVLDTLSDSLSVTFQAVVNGLGG